MLEILSPWLDRCAKECQSDYRHQGGCQSKYRFIQQPRRIAIVNKSLAGVIPVELKSLVDIIHGQKLAETTSVESLQLLQVPATILSQTMISPDASILLCS